MADKRAPRILFLLLAVFAFGLVTGCSNDDDSPAAPAVDTAPPAIPDGIAAWAQVGSQSEIHLVWDTNVTDSDLAGYVLYRSEAAETGYRAVNNGLVNTNEFTDSDLIPGHTYYYKVSARDASGNESGLSQWVAIEFPENDERVRPRIHE